jgi:hypothetical protein
VVTLESQHPSEREREQMLKIMDGTEEDSVRWTLQLFHRCTAMCELDVVMASGEALSCVWGKGGRDEQTGYFEKDLKPIDSRTQVDIGKTVGRKKIRMMAPKFLWSDSAKWNRPDTPDSSAGPRQRPR